MITFKSLRAVSGNRFSSPPPPIAILISRALLLPLSIIILLPTLPAQNCNCSSGINLTGTAISLNALVNAGTLPSGSYNGPCISVPANATLTIDIPYQFSGTTFNMGANAQILVAAPNKLTISNNSVLQGCGALWRGITLAPETLNPLAIPGGQLDMSQSVLQSAEIGIFAQNQSKIRLADNTFTNNYISLRVTGFVPFINFGNPAEFEDNTFTADANYIAPGYDAVTSPLAAIHFDNATTFFIGQDFANPPTVINTIRNVRRGIMADNSFGLGLYGLQISDLTGLVSAPEQSNRVAVRINNSRNINVKYCNIFGTSVQARPWHGIVTFGNSGHKQIYHDNSIVVAGTTGIYVNGLSSPATEVDMQNNYVFAHQPCIQVLNFANGNGNSLFLNKNSLFSRVGAGFILQNVDAPYRVHDNDISTALLSSTTLGTIFQCDGRGDVYKNNFNMITEDDAVFILLVGFSNNCKIYENTLYGDASNPNGLFDAGIFTANCTNLIYCCNSVDNTTYGTAFNFSNNDVRFYTTQYGTHDSALYFQPAATLNAQINTGNNWAGATTSLDAFYPGDVATAIFNAPFRTNPANITATKIEPAGWFQLLGTDPSCSETSTVSCDDLNLPTSFTELTSTDLTALTPANYSNEDVLRFEQKRQLYRKLKENPTLVNWNNDVSDFYDDSQNNIVGAMYEVDKAWRNLFRASATLSASYETLVGQWDDLNDEVADIYAAYPTATLAEQTALLEDLRDLTTQMLEIEADISDLSEQEQDDLDGSVDDLLALNTALSINELWETEEKNINDLFFRYYTGLIDTFNSTQQSQIAALAEECPQFYGAGVYKARFLREQVEGFARHYAENHCVGEERSDKQQITGPDFDFLPNPAADKVLVQLPKNFSQGGTITVRCLDGRAVLTQNYPAEAREQTLDVSNIQPGVYWLTMNAENTASLTAKLVIIR